MAAYADLVRCHWESYDRLSRRLAGEAAPVRIDWSDWHRALAVVNMVAPAHVASKAVELDEAMWRLTLALRPHDVQTWIQLRGPVEGAMLGFVNLARSDLHPRSRPLIRLNGRPAVDDPLWSYQPAPS